MKKYGDIIGWSLLLLVFVVLLGLRLCNTPRVKALPDTPNCAGLKDAPPAGGTVPEVVFEDRQWKMLLGTQPPVLTDDRKLVELDGEGSMLPVADWGHHLLVFPIALGDVRPNHLILFHSPAVASQDVIFHQVIGLGRDREGPFLWTRGVANCLPDEYRVRAGDLVGVVVGVYWGN